MNFLKKCPVAFQWPAVRAYDNLSKTIATRSLSRPHKLSGQPLEDYLDSRAMLKSIIEYLI